MAICKLVLCCLILAACGQDDSTLPSVPTWVVEDRPAVTIGSQEGEAPYLFENIVDIEVTGDGRIVVADAGANAIRVYAPDGEFIRQVGRTGEGPGEFQSLRDTWLVPGDTIGAWDSAARRLTFFASDGAVRTASIDPSVFDELGHANLDLALGPFGDGSIVLGAMSFELEDWTGTDQVTVLRFAADGRYMDSIGEGTGIVREQFVGNRKAPTAFSPYPYFAVRDESVYHVEGHSSTVQVWSGGAVRHLTFPHIAHDLEDAWADLGPSLVEDGSEYFLTLYRNSSMPDEAPQLAGLLIDDAGRIWTKRYSPSTDAFWLGSGGQATGGTWWIADQQGRLLAKAELPDGFSPFHIDGETVVGVGVNLLGVERVEVHRLERAN